MDKGIVKVLEDQVTESEAGAYEVGEQRERNHRYFTLQPLGNEQKGRSQYISPDVMEAVENKKALFKETFLSNRQTVKFTSGNAQAPHEPDAKTAYVNKTFRRNKHTQLFRDGWHDAFVAKREVIKVDWQQDSRTVTLDVTGATQPQVMQLIAQQGQVINVDQSGLQAMPQPQMNGGPPQMAMQGSIDVEVDDSYAQITLITPERFYRDPMAAYPADSQWCTWERDVARGDLVDEGFDEDQVMELAVDYRFRSNEEDSARKAHDKSWTRRQQYDRITNQSHVTAYETYTYMDLTDEQFSTTLRDEELGFEPEQGIALYKVCWAHGEVLKYADGTLAIEEMDEMPFLEWAEMKISHAEFGLCAADVEAHGQKVQSTLKRLIIDNQQMRNNTRYEAVIGALKNPRDLLDNRIGGAIWSRQIGSVAPLATPELSPLTFNVIQMLKTDSESRDGMSALGKGMNTDAIKYQNSDNMIERLTNAGTRRPMSAAHDWAENFLIPLSQMIVRLAMKHDQSQTQLEVRGKMIPVVPQQWQDDVLDMEVAVALTPQEGKEHAQNLMMMHSVMGQDPDMMKLYGLTQKHALMDSVFDALGVSDTTPFMQRPDDPQFQKQMQEQMQSAEQEKQKAEMMQQLAVKMEQSKDRLAWETFKWNQTNDMSDNLREDEKAQNESMWKERDHQLDWTKFRWEQQVDVAEVRLEEKQERPVGVGNQ